MFMKAYNFQTLVDLYNNVPYTQALQGTSVSNPAYDNGRAIYDDIAKRMDTAISLFKLAASGNTSITGDIMFSGDALQWVAFANTVKLRLLVRQSQVADRQAYVSAEAAKLAGASYLTTDATVNPGYLNSAGKTNPFWGQNVNTSGTYTQDLYRAGEYGILFYQNNNDPRLSRFYTATAAGTFNGNYFGDQECQIQKHQPLVLVFLESFSQLCCNNVGCRKLFSSGRSCSMRMDGPVMLKLLSKRCNSSFTYLGLTNAQAQTYYSQAGNKQTTWDATSTPENLL